MRRAPADVDLCPLYGPLIAPSVAADGCYVIGRIAQSLDGYIATTTGASQWISGPEDIAHTHRLRALFDAVIIGAGTVRADNPQLTTREVEGPSPVRVVLDTERRLGARYRVFNDGPRTLLCCAADAAGGDRVGGAEVVRLPRAANGLDIGAMRAALADRGLRRIFVEGGGVTVSRFLAAGALDRLHVTIAPMLMGSGIPAFTLPKVVSLADVPRYGWSVYRFGADVLVDIPLTRV
ncbi:MAG TPA: RibD family protein [Acetobacteraceae bacterium]|nr:RibD family protein [Acetobacteraceae bacterium]